MSRARIVDTLCRRYGCLPSQLMEEDASELLHMMVLLKEGTSDAE